MLGPMCLLYCEAVGKSNKAGASLQVGGRPVQQREDCCRLPAALASKAVDSADENYRACVSGPARSLRQRLEACGAERGLLG